jgi:hypothetical protein
MKTFYLKLLTIIAVLAGIYISLNYYYTYTQYKNFQIINERQAVIIQLPNSEYIEIASRNDYVADSKEFFEKPFNVNTKIQKNSNLENSIVRTDTYIEYIENGEQNKRAITITPLDNKTLDINLSTKTAYMYIENLKYNIQIDYSNRTEYRKENASIFFEDKGCRIEIYDESLDYDITDNKQSLVLSRAYDIDVEFNIKLAITCKE